MREIAKAWKCFSLEQLCWHVTSRASPIPTTFKKTISKQWKCWKPLWNHCETIACSKAAVQGSIPYIPPLNSHKEQGKSWWTDDEHWKKTLIHQPFWSKELAASHPVSPNSPIAGRRDPWHRRRPWANPTRPVHGGPSGAGEKWIQDVLSVSENSDFPLKMVIFH